MIPPDTAAAARNVLALWARKLRSNGEAVPDGWDALVDLLAASARQTPDLLPLDRAAQRAGVSVRTLRRWRADGLTTVRRGGRLLVPVQQLDQWTDR